RRRGSGTCAGARGRAGGQGARPRPPRARRGRALLARGRHGRRTGAATCDGLATPPIALGSTPIPSTPASAASASRSPSSPGSETSTTRKVTKMSDYPLTFDELERLASEDRGIDFARERREASETMALCDELERLDRERAADEIEELCAGFKDPLTGYPL